MLKKIVNRIPFLKDVPIIANVDFGHTSPKITIPLGGKVLIKEQDGKTKFIFKKF